MSEFSVRPDWMAFLSAGYFEAEVQADADVNPVPAGGRRAAHDGVSEEVCGICRREALYRGQFLHGGAASGAADAGNRPRRRVITTPLTFASTANTILHRRRDAGVCGYRPGYGAHRPAEIEKKVTNRTRAVVPVHYSGLAADLGAIGQICDAHNLFLSEDAAHAVETRYNGELIGHHPRGTVSYSLLRDQKIWPAARGGALVTDDDEIAAKAQVLSCHGMSAGAWNRYGKGRLLALRHRGAGLQIQYVRHSGCAGADPACRMSDMQRRRFEAVDVYERAFADVPELRLQKDAGLLPPQPPSVCAAHRARRLTISRDQFIEELKARNVGNDVHFIALHTMSAYAKRFGYKPEDFPKAYAFSESEISLPLYSTLGVKNAEYVADAVLDVVKKYRK